jgi:hypothetical protein
MGDFGSATEAWLRIELGGLGQLIMLVAKPRHYGRRQWYFVCSLSDTIGATNMNGPLPSQRWPWIRFAGWPLLTESRSTSGRF